MKYGHLERIKLKLKAHTPVFIGSGETLTKKEYILDKRRSKIYMPNLGKLIGYLYGKSLLPKFERFLLEPRNNDLAIFLSKNKIGFSEYSQFIDYSIDAGEAIKEDKFRGILSFMKGADGYPYIPGSSLKGAIRTAIAAIFLQNGNYQRNISDIERAASQNRVRLKYYISNESRALESRLFCRLGLSDPKKPNKIRKTDIINDIMRGLQISDSNPIGYESLTLCGKYDRKPDGDINSLPIFRECLIPNTEAEFSMTMDKTVLTKFGVDVDFIIKAINGFAKLQYEMHEKYFADNKDDADLGEVKGALIVVGGGSGYVSKTITYPLVKDRQRTLKLVGTILTKQFYRHKHHNDAKVYKVSPHTLKTTMYNGRYYKMGQCELVFE